MLSMFGSTLATSVNAHLQYRVSSPASVHVLQTATSLCCYSFQVEFQKIGQLPTASVILLMVSRIIYSFQ